MPLPSIRLDDLTYADLVAEAIELLPTLDRGWTDHNPSDPGITLIELFAWLAEMLIYRADRVTEPQMRAFLRLIWGRERADGQSPPDGALPESIRTTLQDLRRPHRAVSTADFEAITLETGQGRLARARCLPGRDFSRPTPESRGQERRGELSVIVLSKVLMGLIDGVMPDLDPAGRGEFRLGRRVGEAFYVGNPAPFGGMRFQFSRHGVGYNLMFQYLGIGPGLASPGWRTLEAGADGLYDGTRNWTRDGEVRFQPPSTWVAESLALDPMVIGKTPGEMATGGNVAPVPPLILEKNSPLGGWAAVAKGERFYWLRIRADQKNAVSEAVARHVATDTHPGLDARLRDRVWAALDQARLLTTRHHVLGPTFVVIDLELTLLRKVDADESALREAVAVAIAAHFDPLRGGADGAGWPFGREVRVSELYQILARVRGVRDVRNLKLEVADGFHKARYDERGELIAIELEPHVLPRLTLRTGQLRIHEKMIVLRVRIQITARGPDWAKPQPRTAAALAARREVRRLVGDLDQPGSAQAVAIETLLRGVKEVLAEGYLAIISLYVEGLWATRFEFDPGRPVDLEFEVIHITQNAPSVLPRDVEWRGREPRPGVE